MKLDPTTIIAVLTALGLLGTQLSKIMGDRTSARISVKEAEDALSEKVLKRAKEMLSDQEEEIQQLKSRVAALEGEVAMCCRLLAEHGIEPPRLGRVLKLCWRPAPAPPLPGP